MRKMKSVILLLPLLFSLGACNTKDEDMSINLSDLMSDSQVEDMIKNFVYDNSIAARELNALAAKDGYSFTLRVENEVLPDSNNESVYFDIVLNGKGNLTWASVNQVDKQGNKLANYQALLEEDTQDTYVNDGARWYKVSTGDYNFPYKISDIKGLLLVTGQYLPFLTITGVIKTRTLEINRECVKYHFAEEPDQLTIVVDRKTQILTHLIEVKYVGETVTKRLVRMDAFNESCGDAPQYK